MDPLVTAVLVIGGIWILGRVSRFSPQHPANLIQPGAAPATAGNTWGTGVSFDTAQHSDPTVAGEPLDSTICCSDSPAHPPAAAPTIVAPRNPVRFPVDEGGRPLPVRFVAQPVRSRIGFVTLPPQRVPTATPRPTLGRAQPSPVPRKGFSFSEQI